MDGKLNKKMTPIKENSATSANDVSDIIGGFIISLPISLFIIFMSGNLGYFFNIRYDQGLSTLMAFFLVLILNGIGMTYFIKKKRISVSFGILLTGIIILLLFFLITFHPIQI